MSTAPASATIDLRTGELLEESVAVKPIYRIVISLHLKGMSNQEISESIPSLSYTDVSEVITSDWGRKQVANALLDDTRAIQKILESSNLDNIYTLQQLRDCAESESVRLNAAKELMHMAIGKPTQRTRVDISDLGTTAPEVRDKQLNAEISALLGRSVS